MSNFRLFEPTNGPGDNPDLLTVQGIITAYLENKRFEHVPGGFTAAALDRCQRYLKIFAKKFGHKTIADCHKSDLQKFLLEHPQWESTFTRQDAVGTVVTAFRWAEDEFSIYNPYRRPKYLGPPIQPRSAILPEEYQAIRLVARRAKTRRGRRARQPE
jgi:hypothetical protein